MSDEYYYLYSNFNKCIPEMFPLYTLSAFLLFLLVPNYTFFLERKRLVHDCAVYHKPRQK